MRLALYASRCGWLLIALFFLSGCANSPQSYSSKTKGFAKARSPEVDVVRMQARAYSERVKFLVMHFTAIDYQKSVNALVDGPYVSSHYLVPESNDPSYPYDKLKVFQLVDETKRAWHAGRSHWQGRDNINDQAIGIEIVNVPQCQHRQDIPLQLEDPNVSREHGEDRLCLFPDYDPRQVELLIELARDILARNPDIGPTQVVGHSDITPSRKNDPGPRFPWYQLYKAGIGAWYDEPTVHRYWQQFIQSMPSVGLLQKAMRAYGYGVTETGFLDGQTRDTLSAFQMHFLPHHVTGEPDAKTAATLFALVEKYFPEQVEALMTGYQTELLLQAESSQQDTFSMAQVDAEFPESDPDTPQWVKNRRRFKTYQGQGVLTLQPSQELTAELFVNGEKLNIASPLMPGETYRYSLGRRTQDGLNTFRVGTIEPAQARLRAQIDYPTLHQSVASGYDFGPVDALINDEINQGFPGAVLVVVKDGKIVKHQAYGVQRRYADGGSLLTQPQPMHKNTLFDLASNTKMFATNYALMKLVSDGRLDIDAPISAYLAEYRSEGREQRRVRDLLTHTAGYAPEVRFFSPENHLGQPYYSQTPGKTKALLSQYVPFEVAYGTPLYSDTDYMLLGMLVERITGMPLDRFVETQLYQPLGLVNTKFNPLDKGHSMSEFAATEIHGNSRNGWVQFPNMREYVLQGEVHDEKAFYSMAGVSGHAGLFSNAGEMAVLTQVLLNRGGYGETRLFSPTVMDQFLKASDEDITLGLGWRRAGNGERRRHFGPYASPQAIGHTGWTGTVTVIDPAYDLSIILLTNRKHTPVEEDEQGQLGFTGDSYELGRYGSIVSLVYEAVLAHQ
ncbi:N-acetylmuramoyl-L-alanine amidase [Saliniradius amylolyticus]|uniref:N-acetylmuramoyl-L-alanine amidase n=1 Tax=Saliniradius amylolyticus TaxID=2183582 RepID=A0A2S2E5A5_9ALTE|nr:penicillin binding protein PBP4B [Saliniradius amylolyticus]AWL12836.1 N-acetylmuramoyl-L-alanine amidase [Saliniradius amylolyticus]